MPLNLDEIIAKSRAKTEADQPSLDAKSSRNGSPDKHNSSYNRLNSDGSSRGSQRKVTMESDMTEEERDAAALAKLMSAMGGGGNGGGPKLKTLVRKSILQKQFDPSVFLSDKKGDETSKKNTTAELNDPDLVPPNVVLDVWHGCADGVASGDVDCKLIHSALETAKKYYVTSKEGREFVDKNLAAVTNMMLSQSPRDLSSEKDRLGQSENDYVEKGIRFALQLINDDLRSNAHKFTVKCKTLNALSQILDYKDVYYDESPPEVRMDKISVFQRIKGFYHLAVYINARANTTSFPEWELVHRALTAAYECIVYKRMDGGGDGTVLKFCKEVSNMCVGVMKHLKSMKKETLEDQEIHKISTIVKDIKQLQFEFALADPQAPLDYFDFIKALVVLLLPAVSLEHKEYGQDMLHELIEMVHSFRPAIGAYNVNGAGYQVVNGTYSIASRVCDNEGHIIPGIDVSYERVDSKTGKKLLLFRDETFETDATWCLSEEHDDEQREPDYTDYYTAVSDGPQRYPPLQGWEMSEGSKKPSPTLQPLPKMIPVREQHKTIKEDLSRWLLEKKIPDLVVGTEVSAASDAGNISSLMEALDGYMKESNYVTGKMANLFVAILPSIQRKATPNNNGNPRGFARSSSSMAALEAAKQRLASAERWEQNTLRALGIAQTEHQAASTEVEEARAYMKQLDQEFQQSYQNGGVERELSLRNVFESNDDNPSVDSSITSATGADHEKRPSLNFSGRRARRNTIRRPTNRRGSA